ncbi:ABC transporter substrate-binding protein [Micromonospora mirobrigensis]|uniref:Carbohydrate ABC transporter substrate-binding protein, CUT1 family n=1 Tax=Micromonospora mirobrigensis TaxID=262898 RepID=A0A1C5AL68_9ACTN|nr:ABC transporter substrate-binding protein [Micromonospora mirobrigensis]SCF45744.1 carbohydrate ABC transporter substrate-binding protein, CUT1 family [Micromonospora mirobrigensis]
MINSTSAALRRLSALAAVGLTATIALAGCGSGSSGTDGEEFTYWSMWQQTEPQAKVLQGAIDGFTKDTNIKVNVEWQGREVLTKLVPTLRTGAKADLVDQSLNAIGANLVLPNQYADLSPAYEQKVDGEDVKVSDVIPEKYRRYLTGGDGKPFMVPYEVASEAIWFDAAKYPKLAEKPPATWEQFVQVLDDLKKSGIAPLALDADNPGAAAYWPQSLLIRALGPDGYRDLATDKTGAKWDDPKVKQAVDELEKLVKGGYFVKGYDASQYPAQQNAWAQGKAALLLQGSWVPSETKGTVAPGFRFDSFDFPTFDGGSDAVPVNFFGFAIPKSAKHAAPAQKFIAYFLNKSRLTPIATQAANITPRADIEAPKELATLKKSFETKDVFATSAGVPLVAGDLLSNVWRPAYQSLMQGESTGAQFLVDVKSKQADYWKSHG